MIKKADIALFFIILIFGLAISWLSLNSNADGDKVVVSVANKVYGIYDINEDQTIKVPQEGHQNNITIKDGVVSMTYSDCKNQVCVETHSISQTKDSIVCLPNKVMVEIVSENQGGDIDVISG